MQKRTAAVSKINLNGLTYSAVFNIGDTTYAGPQSKGIAVQKEGAAFHEDDGIYFKDYSLFHREANWPPIAPTVEKNTVHHRDTIQVDSVRMIGVSQTAIFQVGSIDKVDSEARIKHLRRYLNA
ncbi:spore germination protein GerPE [Lentibacillus sp. CBA3610]|uniref:spore germination protein GerPE n=1 Tax=Lentibacillus sp. CBA3610 TaxID=2518176 RepID=UPI001595F9F6|nr:spore germination protein GerPE [Lentibacillus sp. CBA3610]QKY68539.1 spore germination protein GerPE [Lentibacillus sp. CBA3610]